MDKIKHWDFIREPVKEKELSEHELQEYYFHEVVEANLLDSYESEMRKFGFDDEQIYQFRESVLNLDNGERDLLFSFPWELKQRILPGYLKDIRSGESSVPKMVSDILKLSSAQHRRIAYHSSGRDISKTKIRTGRGESQEWVVRGTEPDHRDEDIPMAYYSFDYYHLYREKNPKYIYIVSSQADERAGHRKDGNEAWGRAPSLSIVDKIDIQKTDALVEKLVKQRVEAENNKKNQAALSNAA